MRVAYRHRVVKVVIFACLRSTQPTFNLGRLSESGFTGLEDFQDKSGGGKFGASSIRNSASRHLSCVDRDRHGLHSYTNSDKG